jgi:hypothetical protein
LRSLLGLKRTCVSALQMSAFGGKADIASLHYQNLIEELPRVERCPLLRSLLGVKRT